MDATLIKQIQAARARAVGSARTDLRSGSTELPVSARTQVQQLLDADSFVEYGALAGRTTHPDDDAHADGLIAGVGLIAGAPVAVAAYDTAVYEGRQSDRNTRKIAKLLYLAVEHRWPFVCFAGGLGARTDDPFMAPPIAVAPRGRFDLFDGMAELNGWAPTVAIVDGTCLDAHAAIAMLADFTVATQDTAFGTEAAYAASAGDSADCDSPNGDGDGVRRSAADFAATGNIDALAPDLSDAIAQARAYLTYWQQPQQDGGAPSANADQIADLIPDNRRRPYDMRSVLAAFADADSVLETGAAHGRSMLTAFARLNGRAIGIYANQPKSPLAGAIDVAAADKAARFVELCDAYDFPIVTFVDNPGYMVGPKSEQEGIARHHARPLAALHHRTVPVYSVQIRKAYGLGPYAMSGWGAARRVPDLRLAWPSVESGGMSLEGAAYLVKRKEIVAAQSKEEALRIRNDYAEKMRDATSGLRAGRSYQFDDVIHPTATRAVIGALLAATPTPRASQKKHAIDLR